MRSELAAAVKVTARSSKHLRAVATLVIATLLLVSGAILFAEAQQSEVRRNIFANDNVHVIDVTYRSGGDMPRSLRYADATEIGQIADSVAGDSAEIATYASLPVGIEASDDHVYFVEALIGAASTRLLATDEPDDGAALSSVQSRAIDLRVPVVEQASDGGMISARVEEVPLDIVLHDSGAPIDVFAAASPTSLRLNASSFERIVSIMTGTDWATFQRNHDSTANPYGFESVRSTFVYLESIDDVVPVAAALENDGFDTNYTLKAFDDLASTANASLVVAVSVVALALAVGVVLIVINARSYLRLARRDFGVLIHLGYERDRVARLYRSRIAQVLWRSSLLPLIVVLIASTVLFWQQPVIIAINALVLFVIVSGTYVAIAWGLIRRMKTMPVLALIKQEREFA